MPMPEAAIHKYNLLLFRQHDVRPTRKVPQVQLKSKPQGTYELANGELGLGVLTPDSTHEDRTLIASEDIGQLVVPKIGKPEGATRTILKRVTSRFVTRGPRLSIMA